jgi:PTS system nitrogen regulatory IIA component
MTPRICDALDRRHVIPGLEGTDKATVLQELARRAAVALKMDETAIAGALMAREQLGSTGVGGGVAIPHARIVGLDKAFCMFARIEPAIDFSAIDGGPVDLALLLLTPDGDASGSLALLASLARRLRDRAVVSAIRAAANAKEIYAAFAGEP